MTKIIIIWITVTIAGCSAPRKVQVEQHPWKLALDKNGIQVYTRSIEGIEFLEFKGVTQIPTSISSLVALIRDTEATPQWIANCAESKILKRIDDNETLSYSFSKAPWPMKNRDVVIHTLISIDQDTSMVTVIETGKPDAIAEREKTIRVQRFEGFWRFTPQSDGQIEVVYQLLSDPGGGLPAWFINSSAIAQPYETLRAMKAIVQQKKYQNAALSEVGIPLDAKRAFPPIQSQPAGPISPGDP